MLLTGLLQQLQPFLQRVHVVGKVPFLLEVGIDALDVGHGFVGGILHDDFHVAFRNGGDVGLVLAVKFPDCIRQAVIVLRLGGWQRVVIGITDGPAQPVTVHGRVSSLPEIPGKLDIPRPEVGQQVIHGLFLAEGPVIPECFDEWIELQRYLCDAERLCALRGQGGEHKLRMLRKLLREADLLLVQEVPPVELHLDGRVMLFHFVDDGLCRIMHGLDHVHVGTPEDILIGDREKVGQHSQGADIREHVIKIHEHNPV